MLSLLHIENIAIIELSDMSFDGRLNVLTGETGAGKSIIIDALSALLGQRASRDLIRAGYDAATVSGVFCRADGTELMLARELRGDGRSLCRADGKPLTLAVLRELGDGLVNIHGQHDSQTLLREETHIRYLDAYAGVSLARYAEVYGKWTELCAERDALCLAEDEKQARADLLTARLEELRRLELKAGEEDALSARAMTLRGAEQIVSALNSAYFHLYGDEESRGACELTVAAAADVSSVAGTSHEMEELSGRLNDLQYSLRDCAEEIRDVLGALDGSEDELEQIGARLDAISRLRRKHNMNLDAILSAAEGWETELAALERAEGRLADLEGEIAAVQTALRAEGRELTLKREAAARSLVERMEGELSDLDMSKVRFSVDFQEVEPGANGCDAVVFLIATNAGEPLKPLARIASGGEMARIMLALKNLLAEGDAVGTLVFDEVDSGVSGRAAQSVARKLCDVSRHKQVLCVTHLPQIAAFADSHFHVEKAVEDGRTVTRVTKLNRAERVEELAKITAGAAVTNTARAAAEELLTAAEEYKALTGGCGV